MSAPTIQQAIEAALDDARDDYELAGIIVVRGFEATNTIVVSEPALREALYTIFRGLPARLVRGATLFVGTTDRAGGDIELVWDAREPTGRVADVAHPRELLRAGPYGDLFELAVLGLETICRARAGLIERQSEMASGMTTSTAPARMQSEVMRRFSFLIPSPARDRASY